MPLKSVVLIAASALLFSPPLACFATPQTGVNSKGFPVKVSHLDDEDLSNDMCAKGSFDGKVVARRLNDIGIVITGFTIEHKDGTRDYINVAVPKNLDAADMGMVTQGLQLLTKIGRHVSGQIYSCGAAGRVMILDEIK